MSTFSGGCSSCGGRRTTTPLGKTVIFRHYRPDGSRIDFYIKEDADASVSQHGGYWEQTTR